jgi:hypothetical protein
MRGTGISEGHVKGVQLFLHSVKQVFGNLGAAIRISGLLFVIQLIVSLLVIRYVLGTTGEPAGLFLVSIILLLFSLFVSLWIAVAWHRFVLRVERPGAFLPAFHGARMLAYLGYSIVIGVALAIVVMVLSFLVAQVAPVNNAMVRLLGGLVVFVPVFLLALRLSPLLPAAALGDGLSLGDAWGATKGATGDLLVLAFLAALASVVIDLPAFGLTGAMPLAMTWSLITAWIKTMVGASILTTIYGHYVEGRPLA